MPDALLSVRNLACERGGRLLFRKLDFDLPAGQLLRLAGPNGSGKSTLLKVLTGLSSDFQGDISWRGEPIDRVRDSFLHGLCYLGHQKAVKPMLTVTEQLQWFRSLYPCRDDVTIDQALAQFGLAHFHDFFCGRLSAGQQQRVALARLWLSAADLWILDEPFTAIDRDGIAAFETLIADYVASGGAVILTTHHPLQIAGETITLGDR